MLHIKKKIFTVTQNRLPCFKNVMILSSSCSLLFLFLQTTHLLGWNMERRQLYRTLPSNKKTDMMKWDGPQPSACVPDLCWTVGLISVCWAYQIHWIPHESEEGPLLFFSILPGGTPAQFCTGEAGDQTALCNYKGNRKWWAGFPHQGIES